jgi:hypothetical protein
LNEAVADANAAAAVTALIGQLPDRAAVTLADKPAVIAARAAFDQLTGSGKALVTNLSKLTDAEAAIVELETPVIPVVQAVVTAAFSDAAGYSMTFKLSTAVDATYGIQADKFQVSAGSAQVTATAAVYDPTDPGGQTIKLTFASPVFLNETSAALSIQGGAILTSNNELVAAISNVPVITFSRLDLLPDNRIGVDDIALLSGNPALQIDVNRDGLFNRDDVLLLLGRISPYGG